MAALVWDAVGEHWFEIGVDHGVVYPVKNGAYQKGVAWNGLTAVTEQPEGAEPNDQYADNIKYITLRSMETFGATIEAFTYPEEFKACDGSAVPLKGVSFGQQPREKFGFCYRTLKGNDVQGQDAGYILHLLYGCTVSPSEKAYATINDSPEAITFSWELDTDPVQVTGYKPTACVSIDSTEVDPLQLARLERYLYGSEDGDAALPMPDQIVTIMETPMPSETISIAVDSPAITSYLNSEFPGKTPSDFQENLAVTPTGSDSFVATGTSHYITDMSVSEFDDDTGNWIVFEFKPEDTSHRIGAKYSDETSGLDHPFDANDFTVLAHVNRYLKQKDKALTLYEYAADGQEKLNTFTVDLSKLELDQPADSIETAVESESIVSFLSKYYVDKTPATFQDNLTIEKTGANSFVVNGTSHHLTGFTAFNPENPDEAEGNWIVFEFKPADETHRVGCKRSTAAGGDDVVADKDDFTFLIRLNNYLADGKTLTIYEYDSSGEKKLETYTVDLSKITVES